MSAPASNPIPFIYQGQHIVRVLTREGDPWFLAKDACDRLGLTNVEAAIQSLDPDERSSANVRSSDGPQESALISEPGLYRLLGRRRTPEARAFDRFVRHDILPTISRPTSSVSLPHDPRTVRELNAASRFLGELRRTLGIRQAAKATPGVLAKIGLPALDPSDADIFRQGELNLSEDANGGNRTSGFAKAALRV